MRGKLLGAALLASGALALTGCANPAGVDGNLTNNWSGMPEPTVPVPAEKVCYEVSTDNPAELTRWPPSVACNTTHTVETLHVGAFTGEDAQHDSPPAVGGPGRRKAYEECAASAKEFLGGDWRSGRLDVFVPVPTVKQWEGGARWFRCDVVEYNNLDDFEIAERGESLQAALTGARKLALGCFNATEKNGDIDTMVAVECTAAHNTEYTGVWDAPDGPYPADTGARNKLHLNGCRAVTAGYVGIPNDSNFQYRTGQITFPFGKADWEQGNRGVRCYLWLNKNISRSLKGAGVAGLPINYG